MTGMKPKDVIKLDTAKLSKTYPEKTYCLKMVYKEIYISLVSSIET